LTAALSLLENALWSAEGAHAADLLQEVISELEAVQSANPKGRAHLEVMWLLKDAQRALTEVDPDAGHSPGFVNLDRRLRSLLLLLPHAADLPAGDDALDGLASLNAQGDIAIGADAFKPWMRLLGAAYDRGYETFAEVSTHTLRDARQQIERTLRSVAAQLVTVGARVRGLSADAVPVVAFALLHGDIPVGVDAASSPVSQERMDNAVLAIADEVADMARGSRAAFMDMYRLSLLLGVAHRYAEQLSLTTLATD
jgi:hypothetical protein